MAPKIGPVPAMLSSWIRKIRQRGMRHVIHAVVERSPAGRFGPRIGPREPFQVASVSEIGRDEQGQTKQKGYHFRRQI